MLLVDTYILFVVDVTTINIILNITHSKKIFVHIIII